MNRDMVGIINPNAGSGSCGKKAEALLREIKDMGISIRPFFTEKPEDATHLARTLWQKGERAFVVFGGDGTTFEVLNGIFPQAMAEPPLLSTIALGTGNSFLRDVKIFNSAQAVDALIKENTQFVDVVQVDHADGTLFYLNILGLGFTAAAGDLTNRKFKFLGTGGYVAAALLSLVGLKYSNDELDLGTNETQEPWLSVPNAMLSFCNSQFTAGALQMAPQACPWDGKVDVVHVGAMTRLELLNNIFKTPKGTHVHHPKVHCAQTETVEFSHPRKQPVMVDGEILHLEIHSLKILPKALRITSLL